MDCPEFLDTYSDFRDGLITDPLVRQQMRRHTVDCVSCARYDASVRHGIRALGEVEVSPEFRDRLRARIAATAGRPLAHAGPGATSVAAGLMLAAAVALLVYEGATDRPPVMAARQEAPPLTAPLPVAPATAANVETSPLAIAPADSSDLPRAVAIRRAPYVVVNPGVPFVVFSDMAYQPAAGSSFSVQATVPIR